MTVKIKIQVKESLVAMTYVTRTVHEIRHNLDARIRNMWQKIKFSRQNLHF